jgi:hypothetical protein
MPPAHHESPPTDSSLSPDRAARKYFGQLARVLYTHNPFYLLSVAFVLHSTRLWYEAPSGAAAPWPLMGIICGYILLVAMTGIVLVRFGKVWDDARSILLILLLLFVELSLTFDSVLINHFETGRVLLLTGLAFSMLVSEGVLVGLRIRLPVLFRIPYHLLLALLFLYPWFIVSPTFGNPEGAVWRIFLFSPTAAIVLLTLLPAIRRGPQYVRDNGTAWAWPWFPWPLFGFLAVCIVLRAYALSLSFDPVLTQPLNQAMQLDSALGTYALVPLLLAAGVLLLEAGIVSASVRAQSIALVIPAVCFVLALPDPTPTAPYADFLAQFTNQLGSPLWLTASAGMAFFFYAAVRRVRYAQEALLASLAAAVFVGPQTVGPTTMSTLQTWPLWLIASFHGIVGLRRLSSYALFIAAVAAVAAFRTDFLGNAHWLYRDWAPVQVLGLVILGLGGLFHDRFANYLRKAGLLLLITSVLTAAVWPVDLPTELPGWARLAYLSTLLAATFGSAYGFRNPAYFFAGLGNSVVVAARLLYDLTGVLQRDFGWKGAGFFVLGLVWFVLAVAISATKAGILERLATVVPRPEGNQP